MIVKADENKRQELLFAVRRSVRYHSLRRQFFDRWHRIIKFLTVISGTATITTLLSTLGDEWKLAAALFVTFFSVFDLVVGTSEKARLHSELEKEFIELRKEIIAVGEELNAGQFAEFMGSRLDIEAREPKVQGILNVICHNDIARAMGFSENEQYKLSVSQRWLANYIDIGLHKLKKWETKPNS